MRGNRTGAPVTRLDETAADYVRLVLAVGQHDAAYVDAYYGSPEWLAEAARVGRRPLGELAGEAGRLRSRLNAVPRDAEPWQRASYMLGQLRALQAHCERLGGRTLSFDEEAWALYQVRPPHHPTSHFEARLEELRSRLPGAGSVQARYLRYRDRFVVPRDRLDAVFTAAISEARSRSSRHLTLPEGERFDVEYVTGKPWSGYNWFKGQGYSVIQVNTDVPVVIDRALDLAAHEGYPGHHVYNSLLEQHALRERGWVEVSVYALFSPQSVIAEGTANFGIDVAFPGDERTRYERDVLFPLAGLDPLDAEPYAAVRKIAKGLAHAGNEAARDYLDGRISGDAAQAYLQRYALMTPAQAAQRVRFFDAYRSYVVNYNVGEDLVRQWVERQGGTPEDPGRRWRCSPGC